jgi:predicted ATPase/DNA-binding CsgD family transcriptional regulator
VPPRAHLISRGVRPGPTPIFGREDDVATVLGFLDGGEARLVTLTGPAGVGKTRFAEEVASRARRMGLFRENMWFVPLQNLRDADLVLPMIASAIGLDHPGEGDTLARLMAEIGERRMLLMLDNMEQVIESAAHLSVLLAECPELSVLVTSRRALNVRVEHAYSLTPLALPVLTSGMGLAAVEESPAVQSFVHFARARSRTFSLAPENAEAVAAICHHLDGLPLALELAAARMAVLSPQGLLRQLQARTDVLDQGPVDLPMRHRRMHDAIAWSYELLAPVEQRWFRRLAVLEGTFDLATVGGIGDPTGLGEDSTLDVLTELVQANLVIAVGDEDGVAPRFRMLETVRTFGMSLLADRGEVDTVRRLYANHMLDRIQNMESGPDHGEIAANVAGIRAFLTWSWSEPDERPFLELVVALESFWHQRSYLEEGCLWLDRAVSLVRQRPQLADYRVRIFLGAATLARRRADFPQAEPLARAGLEEATTTGDAPGVARALNALGAIAIQQSAFQPARDMYERALDQYRAINDVVGEAVVLHNLALVTLGQHDLAGAVRLWEGALPVARRAGKPTALIAMLRCLGGVRLAQGRGSCAKRLLQEALLLSQREIDAGNIVQCHALLADMFVAANDLPQADVHASRSVELARSTGEPAALVLACISRAQVECERGEMAVADSLLAEAHAAAVRFGMPLAYQPVLRAMADLRRRQGEVRAAYDLYGQSLRCWQQGGDVLELLPLLLGFADVSARLDGGDTSRRMVAVIQVLQGAGLDIPVTYRDLYQGLRLTCSQTGKPMSSPDVCLAGSGLQGLVAEIFDAARTPVLSGRERAVLELLANGQTNAQMAERLFVSPHTINTHVRRIYEKIGVNSRSAATRFAIERGMVGQGSPST